LPYDITTNSWLSVTFEGRQAGQQIMNVMNYVYEGDETVEDGPLVVDELDTLITAADDLWERWLGCMSNNVTSCKRFYQWFHPIRYAWIGKGLDVETAGALEMLSPGPNWSQAVTRRTNFAGREEVSTLKLAGVPAERIQDGFLTDPQMTVLQDFADRSVHQYVLGSGSKMTPVPWNRVSPGSANQLRTAYAHNTVRVMRRRTVGLGS